MKSTDTIRWGIVGSGMMALEHIANIALTPNAVVTALADPVATSLDRAATAVGGDVARFADAAALAASACATRWSSRRRISPMSMCCRR